MTEANEGQESDRGEVDTTDMRKNQSQDHHTNNTNTPKAGAKSELPNNTAGSAESRDEKTTLSKTTPQKPAPKPRQRYQFVPDSDDDSEADEPPSSPRLGDGRSRIEEWAAKNSLLQSDCERRHLICTLTPYPPGSKEEGERELAVNRARLDRIR